MLGIYLFVGFLSFLLFEIEFEGMVMLFIVDVLYFVIVIMMMVGYGDLVFKIVGVKFFICVFVFMGFGFVGVFVSGVVNYFVEK